MNGIRAYNPQIQNISYKGKRKANASVKTSKPSFGESAKKTAKGYLILTAALAAAGILIAVGKNPAKAANYINGRNEVVNPAYNKAQAMLDNMIAQDGPGFSIKFSDLLANFSNPKNMTPLGDKIDELQGFVEKQEGGAPKEVIEAIETLRQKTGAYVEEAKQKLFAGEKSYVERELHEAYLSEIDKPAEIISDYLDDVRFSLPCNSKEREYVAELRRNFFYLNSYDGNSRLRPCIIDCPPEIIAPGQVLYHGTKNGEKVFANGFTPFVSNQISSYPRELGAGIYTTPDRVVAATFSGVTGDIIPVKLPEDAKIAAVHEESFMKIMELTNSFMLERIPKEELDKMPSAEKNALFELLHRKIFMDAGYDAVYIPKAVKTKTLATDVNDVIGRNQSQVIIFSSEKMEIQSRNIFQRLYDVKDKLLQRQTVKNFAKRH